MGCSTLYHPAAPISNIHDISHQINIYSTVNVSSKNNSILSSPKNISIRNYQKDNINIPIYHPVMKTINRDYTNNKIIYNRNYKNIQKGSYSAKSHTIKQGDTLFYISWITGNNFHHLARHNKITKPYNINIGQVIDIPTTFIHSEMVVANHTLNVNNIDIDSHKNKIYSLPASKENSGKIFKRASKPLIFSPDSVKTESFGLTNKSIVSIVWPAKGKVIESFSNIIGGNKGVDIAGLRGQPIFAAAKGKVVYSGNALRGYGNLIIIKHNDDYLSAYAHNDTILVRDQQIVQAGQKIATMGSTDTNSVRLHFEIRYKGKSVNPLHYFSQK